MSVIFRAPWSPEQVEALERWQTAGFVHEYTCPADGTGGSGVHDDRRTLQATTAGWLCLACGYTQDWAHAQSFGELAPPPWLVEEVGRVCGDRLAQDGWQGRCGLPPQHDLPHSGHAVRAETSEIAFLDWVQDGEVFDEPENWEGNRVR